MVYTFLMKLIERDFYLDKLKNVMGTPDIKVITGVRRCGKSKLMDAFIDWIKQNEKDSNIIQSITIFLSSILLKLHSL